MGRAPTSGNCHTCRKRRVKCDKTKPECTRCIRSGFICDGYETVLRIQSHAAVAGVTPGTSQLGTIQSMTSFPSASPSVAQMRYVRARELAAVRAGASKSPAVGPAARPHTSDATDEDKAGPRQATASQPTVGASGSGSPPPDSASSSTLERSHPLGSRHRPTLHPPQDLSLVGFVDDMAFSYFFQAYGWINMHSLLLQDASMRVRLHDAGMTYDSLRALCYGLLGRDKGVSSLQDAGRRMYGQAITALRSKISSTSKEDLASLVKPISLMGSYAITVEQDLRFTHHAGLARILEFCGPEYFQSPALLPIFESVRWTLISDAMVRRKHTFLERSEWKIVPWSLHPESKSFVHRLLDILASVPAILEGVWAVMGDRFEWLLGGCNGPPIEHSGAVANLQARVHCIETAVVSWRNAWEDANPDLAPRILSWAFHRAEYDTRRPGIYGVEGPDVFDTSLVDGLHSDPFAGSSFGVSSLQSQTWPIPTLMQDAALYSTILVWTTRLGKYLDGAAQGPTCVDFFTAPFHTNCDCCSTMPPGQCQTIPPQHSVPNIDPALNWNAGTCTVAAAPVRIPSDDPISDCPSVSSSPTSLHTLPNRLPSESLHPEVGAAKLSPSVLLPGDVRFAAQLRILSWLCKRLPSTRTHVLTTLAAIGLGHCAHDVRPVEGITEVASVAVAQIFDNTGFDQATGVLLRNYRRQSAVVGT